MIEVLGLVLLALNRRARHVGFDESDPIMSDPAVSDPAVSDPVVSDPVVSSSIHSTISGEEFA